METQVDSVHWLIIELLIVVFVFFVVLIQAIMLTDLKRIRSYLKTLLRTYEQTEMEKRLYMWKMFCGNDSMKNRCRKSDYLVRRSSDEPNTDYTEKRQ